MVAFMPLTDFERVMAFDEVVVARHVTGNLSSLKP